MSLDKLDMIFMCPNCGAEPWVNIDCELCVGVGAAESEIRSLRARVQELEDMTQHLRVCASDEE